MLSGAHFCSLTGMNVLFLPCTYKGMYSPCSIDPWVHVCRETWETISFLAFSSSVTPATPHMFSPASPPLILIVSICHTWSVSTGSDAMTWCNDALEHFLQRRYISVQMWDSKAIWKENNLTTLNKTWWHIENVSERPKDTCLTLYAQVSGYVFGLLFC